MSSIQLDLQHNNVLPGAVFQASYHPKMLPPCKHHVIQCRHHVIQRCYRHASIT